MDHRSDVFGICSQRRRYAVATARRCGARALNQRRFFALAAGLAVGLRADADRAAAALRFRELAVLRDAGRALAEREAAARPRDDDTAARFEDLARLEPVRHAARRDFALPGPDDLRASARPRLTLHPTER